MITTYENVDMLDKKNYKELPSPEELSLQNQLAAGINISQIPVSSLLEPDDISSINNKVRDAAIHKLVELGKDPDFINANFTVEPSNE